MKKKHQLKKYRDFGITDKTKSGDKKWKKVKWTKYKIVVPTEADKIEVQSALKHCHDSKDIDTDFITVNQLVHEYEHGDENDNYSNVIVSKRDYNLLVFKQTKRKKK